jgi:hypothetical protein
VFLVLHTTELEIFVLMILFWQEPLTWHRLLWDQREAWHISTRISTHPSYIVMSKLPTSCWMGSWLQKRLTVKVGDFGLSKLGPWTWLWRAWRLLQYRIMLWLQMQINENNNQSMFMTTAREVFCLEVMRPSSFQCSRWWQCYIQSCKT